MSAIELRDESPGPGDQWHESNASTIVLDGHRLSAADQQHVDHMLREDDASFSVASLANLMKVTVTYDHNKLSAILRDILARLQAQEEASRQAQLKSEQAHEALRKDITELQLSVKQVRSGQTQHDLELGVLRQQMETKLAKVEDGLNSALTKIEALDHAGANETYASGDGDAESRRGSSSLATPRSRGPGDLDLSVGDLSKDGGSHGRVYSYTFVPGDQVKSPVGAGSVPPGQASGSLPSSPSSLQRGQAELEARIAKLETAFRESVQEREQLRSKLNTVAQLAEQGAAALARVGQTRAELGSLQSLVNDNKQRLDQIQALAAGETDPDPSDSIVSGNSVVAWSRSNKHPTKRDVAAFVQESIDQVVSGAISERLAPLHDRIDASIHDFTILAQRIDEVERTSSSNSDAIVTLQDNAADIQRELQQQIQRVNATNRSITDARGEIEEVKESISQVDKTHTEKALQLESLLSKLQLQVAKAQEQAERAHGGVSALQLRMYQMASSGHALPDATGTAAANNASAQSPRPMTVVSAPPAMSHDMQHALKQVNQRLDDLAREAASIRKFAGGVEERNMRALAEQRTQVQSGIANCLQRVEAMGKKTRASLSKQLADFERDVLYLIGSARGLGGAAAVGGFRGAIPEGLDGEALAAAAKVQYRCLACDQPAAGMLGPESQLHLHTRLLQLQQTSQRSITSGDNGTSELPHSASSSANLHGLKAQLDAHQRAIQAAAGGESPGLAVESAIRDANAIAALESTMRQAETSLSARANLHRALDSEQRALADEIASSSRVIQTPDATVLPEAEVAARELAAKLEQVRPRTVPVDMEASNSTALPTHTTPPLGSSGSSNQSSSASSIPADSFQSQLASRSLMVVERGREMSVYGNDGHVYKGRGNTRVIFAPPSRARDRRFHLSYLDGPASGSAVSTRTALAAAAAAQAISAAGGLDSEAPALAMTKGQVPQAPGPNPQMSSTTPALGRRSTQSLNDNFRIPTTAVPAPRRFPAQDLTPTVISSSRLLGSSKSISDATNGGGSQPQSPRL